MAETFSSRRLLEQMADDTVNYVRADFAKSPTIIPKNDKVHQIPVRLYTPDQDVTVRNQDLGSPEPDRGVSRPWPYKPEGE